MLFISATAHGEIGSFGRSNEYDATGSLIDSSKDKVFIKAKNVSGGALVDGDIVTWGTGSDGDDGASVTTSTSSADVGACVFDEACADDAVCRCQTYGYKSNVNFDSTNGASAAGNLAFISENFAGKVEVKITSSEIVASDQVVGIFFDVVSASGDAEMFLKMR